MTVVGGANWGCEGGCGGREELDRWKKVVAEGISRVGLGDCNWLKAFGTTGPSGLWTVADEHLQAKTVSTG